MAHHVDGVRFSRDEFALHTACVGRCLRANVPLKRFFQVCLLFVFCTDGLGGVLLQVCRADEPEEEGVSVVCGLLHAEMEAKGMRRAITSPGPEQFWWFGGRAIVRLVAVPGGMTCCTVLRLPVREAPVPRKPAG